MCNFIVLVLLLFSGALYGSTYKAFAVIPTWLKPLPISLNTANRLSSTFTKRKNYNRLASLAPNRWVYASALSVGDTIETHNHPHRVIALQPTHSARQAAFMKVKLKNLVTQAIVERSLRSDMKLKEARVDQTGLYFSHKTPKSLVFQSTEDWSEVVFEKSKFKDILPFLKSGIIITAFWWNKQIVNIILPLLVEYRVIETHAFNKDRASSGKQTVVLETGLSIKAPPFIKLNDKILINTESHSFVRRC